MKILSFCVAALAASAPSFTQTAVPATPSLTAGADFKGLQFDWDPTARASWYQLELRAHRTGDFVQQGDDFPASITSTHFTLPLHLFDWTYARYRLGACNSAGCAYSTEVSVSDLRRFAVGYFKPLQGTYNQRFGDDTDLSSDGFNFVASAPGDSITVNGVAREGGSVNVFKRKPNGVWGQRARLVPAIPPFIEGTNEMYVAISGDGNTVALVMPNFWHEQYDVYPGEIFVFRFNASTAKWVRTRVPRPAGAIYVGDWVGLNEGGDTLAVGIAGGQLRVAIYKLTNGTWQNVRNLPTNESGCSSGVLSRDGSTVAESCRLPSSPGTPAQYVVRTFSGVNWNTISEVPLRSDAVSPNGQYGFEGLGIDRTGNTIAAQIYVDDINQENRPAQVNVFKRSGAGYTQVATFKPGPWRTGYVGRFFGLSVAVSGDASTITVGDSWDNGWGQGPRAAPLNTTTERTGAVYIYRVKGTGWTLANMVKPNKPPPGIESFGREQALSNTGKTLIIGEGWENSAATGIGGDWQTTGGVTGAVWMY